MAYSYNNNYNRGNQIAKSNAMDLKTIANQPAMINKFRQVLGNRADKYVSAIVTAVNTNPSIKDCDPMSIMTCGMKSALLDMDPDPNFGYVAYVPYINHGTKQAQFQMTAKGFTVLAMRSGKYTKLNTGEIYEDEFDGLDIITGEVRYHYVKGGQRDSGDYTRIAGYFAYLEMANGFKKTEYWPKEKVLAHAQRFSKSFKNGPWQTNFDAMARKTVLKYALNHYGLLSVEMLDAIKNDQTVQESFDTESEYVDNAENAEWPQNESDDEGRENSSVNANAKPQTPSDASYEEIPDEVYDEMNSLSDFDGAEEF